MPSTELEPDAKVLDLQKQQPEFKTPVWDYVDGLVDEDRVADGKAAMARQARALARAEEQYGVSRFMLAAIWGVESISARRWASARSCSRSRRFPAWAIAPIIFAPN